MSRKHVEKRQSCKCGIGEAVFVSDVTKDKVAIFSDLGEAAVHSGGIFDMEIAL